MSKLELETFSQSIHIPKVYIAKAEESTPSNYNLRWSGLSYTLGEVVSGSGQAHGDWHSKISGMLILSTVQQLHGDFIALGCTILMKPIKTWELVKSAAFEWKSPEVEGPFMLPFLITEMENFVL